MKTQPLSLEHKTFLTSRFEAMGLCLAEYSFTYLFLCRRKYEYEILFEEEEVWIRGKTADGYSHLMPTEDIQKMPTEELLKKLEWADCFFPIPESWCPSFDKNVFQENYNRNESDYLFKREKIAEYPGRQLSPKRNLLKQFLKSYSPDVFTYCPEHKEAALSVLDKWQEGLEDQKTDYLGCKEALELSQELGLKGVMVYVDSTPAAFILGTISRTNLFGIHFAKALVEYKGIGPFLFREMARHLSENEIACLNWEQDLGMAGLRQSKQSYQPEKIAHKMRIFPRNKE